jgi:hypothetical protein
MRKVVIISLAVVVLAALAMAQESTTPQAKPDPEVLKEFSRSAKMDNSAMTFVLVNDKTADVLFQGAIRFSLKTRARMGTLLYVQALPEQDITQLDMRFRMEQDGQNTDGQTQNIKNFQGGAVAKGTRIDGLVQFDKKLDLTKAFKIIHANTEVEFKLSPEALRIMGQ